MQKSRKLQADEAAKADRLAQSADRDDAAQATAAGSGARPVLIRPVQTYNDYVLILQSKIESSLELGSAANKDEGVVVGVPAGERPEHRVAVGQNVKFYENRKIVAIQSEAGFYRGATLVLVPESAILLRLKDVPVEVLPRE